MNMIEYTTMIKKLTEHMVVRYVISGGTAAVVDLSVLYILNSLIGIHYLPAAIFAFLTAFSVSFTLQKFWTFKSHSTENMHSQVAIYLVVSLFGLVLNTLFMYIFVDFFHIFVLLSQVFVGLIVACCTFPLSRYIVFKNKLS